MIIDNIFSEGKRSSIRKGFSCHDPCLALTLKNEVEATGLMVPFIFFKRFFSPVKLEPFVL